MLALTGKIVFRLDLDESSNEILAASRKRKRSPDKCPETSQTNDWSGFLFYTNPDAPPVWHGSYALLSVPLVLLRRASQAAAHNLPVCIDRYHCMPLPGQIQDKDTALLELHADGLHLLQSPPKCQLPICDFWALSHFRRRETVEGKEMAMARNQTHNILATVDAISPIISLDPKDPFCLVELYDKEKEDNTCVLVLVGHNALVWQPAIQPGDTLLLHSFYRKAWKVPEKVGSKPAFQHLKERIPNFVFLFSKSSGLFWHSNQTDDQPLTTLPSTPVPLVSLAGTILHVERKLTKQGSINIRSIYYVDVELDEQSVEIGERCLYRLYLVYFPMSTAVQLSMQIGARIRAINVHPIEHVTHLSNGIVALGACLRSTITLVSTSSNESTNGQKFPTAFQQPDFNHFTSNNRIFHGIIPYHLRHVKVTYRDRVFRQYAQEWLDDCFTDVKTGSVAPVPSSDDLLRLLRSDSEDNKDSSTIKTQVQKKSGGTRDPYAEFFDHAYDSDASSSQSQYRVCGCSMTREESSCQAVPLLVGLTQIRMAALKSLGKRFEEHIRRNSVSKRWTGSIHLTLDEVAPELCSKEQNLSAPIHVGGFACTNIQTGEVVSLSDKICQLPLRFAASPPSSTGDFVTGRVDSIIVSCFCLLSPTSINNAYWDEVFDGSINVQSLPSLNFSFFENVMGGGALVRVGDFVLVVSVQVRCSEKRTINVCLRAVSPSLASKADDFGDCTLTACISNPGHTGRSSKVVKGLLIRSRFRHAKIHPNGLSNALVLTLSEIAAGKKDVVSPHCLQTVDLKIAVPHTTSKTIIFKRVLANFVPEEMRVLEEECTLAVSWWTISETCSTSLLVAGGWGEYQERSDSQTFGVVVTLPCEAFTTDDRGYVRCSTRLDCLFSEFARVRNPHDKRKPQNCSAFDFVGRRMVCDGMLDSRLARKASVFIGSRLCIGEAWCVPFDSVPCCTLSDLFKQACSSIRSEDPCASSPSLVRRIRGANFLGIAYCCAICKCNRCFKPLIYCTPSDKTLNFDTMADEEGEQSFWHLPARNVPYPPNEQYHAFPGNLATHCLPPHIRKSRLRCPNACPVEHSIVHWECSGFLDDSTGQAKIYAEREVALTLLGIPQTTMDAVEKGIWSSQTGKISFTRSIPPSSCLREQVNFAMSRATRKGPSPLQLLPPATRAEYLVHQHCRTSRRPTRKLDYFVRCKPLSDDVTHLNHSAIESFVSSTGRNGLKACSEFVSYSLPPLKLALVDCSVPLT